MVWVLLVFLVINLFLLGLGTAIGFLLHWILPAVDLGVSILIGVVTTIAATAFYFRLNRITEQIEDEALLEEIISSSRLRAVEPISAGRRKRRRKPPITEVPRP